MPAYDNILVVYPQAGNALYEALAKRLASAHGKRSREATLRPASAVCDMDNEDLSGTVLVVQPAQCFIGLSDQDKFSLRLSKARKRLAVFAESTGTVFFKNQLKMPIRFDAIIDVGFVPQADKLEGLETKYLFLFNGPTREEKRAIERVSPSARVIPWALVGHERGDRVALAHDLMRGLDPGGAVFLPPPRVLIKKNNGMIGPDGLHALLRKTKYYVWRSLHEFRYYESFRFREAILAGAAPCKIDSWSGWGDTGIPGIFPSVEAFVEFAKDDDGFEALLDQAKDYYLSRGHLADRLEEVLESV